MKTLTTPRPLGSANRWRVDRAIPFDEYGRLVVMVQLINNGNVGVAERPVNIEDGMSDRISINTTPIYMADSLTVESRAVSTPTGYVEALAAWRGGVTQNARREALEDWMLASGVAHSSLAGT